MRKFLLAAAAAMALSPACAQPAVQATTAPGAPKLLLVISVDQLSADLFGLFEHERVETQLIAPESG